jgi:hypothetical protein
MEATIENMRAHYREDVLAYSFNTGEEYSANPADYWNAPAGWVMKDEDGEPMRLVRHIETYAELTDDE